MESSLPKRGGIEKKREKGGGDGQEFSFIDLDFFYEHRFKVQTTQPKLLLLRGGDSKSSSMMTKNLTNLSLIIN